MLNQMGHLREEKPVESQDPGGIRTRYLEKNPPFKERPVHLTTAPQGLNTKGSPY